MLFIHTDNIKYSTVGASFTVSFNVGIDEIPVLMALHDYWTEHNMKGYELKAEQTEPQTERSNDE